jgi:DNA invertase Pin-like site-specific DNA recombinase
MSIRSVFYLRYSDRKQARRGGVSIADQFKRLREVAEANGEEIVEILVDQARTGTEMHRREAFQALLQFAREGAMDLVRIESIDRANRNELDRRVMEQELSRYGVEILYLGEDPDQPPEQILLNRGVRGTVAEFESLQTSQRVYKRMRYRAEQGKWRGGKIPFGLQPDGKGWFDKDSDTYPYLLHILRRRAEGWGPFRICGELNRGVSLDDGPPVTPPTPSILEYQRRPYLEQINIETGATIYEPKKEPSPLWNTTTIRDITKAAVDGVYAGVLNWGREYMKLARDSEGRKKTPVRFKHPPLIPEDLIAALRHIEEQPKQLRRGGRPSTFLLHPVCGLCGGPLSPFTKYRRYDTKKRGPVEKTLRYYRCSLGNRTGNVGCVEWSVNADWLEPAVVADVSKRLQNLDQEELHQQLVEIEEATVAHLEKAIAELNRRIEIAEQMKNETTDYLLAFGKTIPEAMRIELEKRTAAALADIERHTKDKQTTETALRRLHERVEGLDLSFINPIIEADRWGYNDEYRDVLRRSLSLLVKQVKVWPTNREVLAKKTAQGGGYAFGVELRDLTDLLGP